MAQQNNDHAVVIIHDYDDDINEVVVDIVKKFDDPNKTRIALIGLAEIAGRDYEFKERLFPANITSEYAVFINEDNKVSIEFQNVVELNIPEELLAGLILSAFLEDQRRTYDSKMMRIRIREYNKIIDNIYNEVS